MSSRNSYIAGSIGARAMPAVQIVNGKVIEGKASDTTPSKGKIVRWSSRGSGVVYEPARGISQRRYRAMQIETCTKRWVVGESYLVQRARESKRMQRMKAQLGMV